MDDVIYLDTDEEITSVVDKMQQCMAKRISLVVPREATILQSVVNLKLIKKEADSLGKEIAIVTGDKIAHNLAGQVGLPIYESLKDSRPVSTFNRSQPQANEVIELDFSNQKQKMPSGIKIHHFQDEEQEGKNKTKKDIEAKFIKSPVEDEKISYDNSNINPPYDSNSDQIYVPKKFLIAIPSILLVVIILAALIFPKAKISLSVSGEPFTKEVEMAVDKDTAQPNIDTNTIPGNLVGAEIGGSKTFKATGVKTEGEKAKGKVTVKNYWDSSPKTFAKGTKLVYKSGLNFIFSQDITVPGATTSLAQGVVTTQPGIIDAEVEADNPGEEYNVTSGRFTISTLSSTMTAKIFAESTVGITGGITKKITVLSQDDIDKAVGDFTNELKPGLISEIVKKNNGKKMVEQVIQISVVDSKVDKKIDEETEEFNLEIKLKGETLAFDESQFMETLVANTEKTLSGKKLLVDQTKTTVSSAKVDGGKLKITTKIDGRIVTNFSEPELKQQISGKKINQAKDVLLKTSDIKQADIWISPSWTLGYLPFWNKNIQFEFKYSQP